MTNHPSLKLWMTKKTKKLKFNVIYKIKINETNYVRYPKHI